MSCGSCRLCFGTKPAYRPKENAMSETTFATALDTLGQLLSSDPGRDAIHLATYAITSDERLFPGQHVGIINAKASVKAPKLIGIVDPFLSAAVFPGQMFWLVLYPRTITSLRHVWTHDDFAPEGIEPLHSITMDMSASERWLRDFAEHQADVTYNHLMESAKRFLNYDEYLIDGGKWEGFRLPEEFWKHYEAVTGTTVEPDQKRNFFSCSC